MTNSPILITGAAQRVGLYCATRWLEIGIPVIVTYRTRYPSIDDLEKKGAITIQADFQTVESILQFIDRVKLLTPSLRAIIHNASEWLVDGVDVEGDFFQRLFMVHMQAPYLINSLCAELLTGSKADIIHISDDAVRKGSVKHAAYCASKAGLENLTLSFARQLAPTVKVNCIAPALVIFNEKDDDGYKKKAINKSLLGIVPGEIEIFNAIEYLLNCQNVTGTILCINGGRHLREK